MQRGALRVSSWVAALCGLVAMTVGANEAPQAWQLLPVLEGLTAPIELKQPDDESGRTLIAQQDGRVLVLHGDGRLADEPFLDLRPRLLELEEGFEERGLLGMAIHPQFSREQKIYVSYSAPLRDSAPRGWNHTRRVSEFTVSTASPDQVDLDSERVLLELDWPSRKHNGGGLAFGPDGYLYVGLGDGGGVHGVGAKVLYSAFEVIPELLHWDRLAQDVTSLFGSILRIDVDRGFPGYGIPGTNPFADNVRGRAEIYAWGFRNPYRIAFDWTRGEGTGDLFVTAIAETLWESIYRVAQPGNFGWPIREGSHCVDRLAPRAPPEHCPRHGALGYRIHDPIIEYPNLQVMHPQVTLGLEGLGTAVVGAQIYRGRAFSQWRGKLVFADWSADFKMPSGQLFIATPPPAWGDRWRFEKLAQLETRIISLARDLDGELYVLTNDTFGPYGESGRVFRLAPR